MQYIDKLTTACIFFLVQTVACVSPWHQSSDLDKEIVKWKYIMQIMSEIRSQ